MNRRNWLWVIAFVAVTLGTGRIAGADTVRVFAAASLTEAFGEIGTAYEKAHPGDRVEFNFAGSQVLRTQIEQGAPADVFASADLAQMKPVQSAGLVKPHRIFARNRLVIIASTQSGKVGTPADLAKPGIKIVVAGATVPVGRYTMQALERMNAGYSGDFRKRAEANIVSQETNVRAVLSKVTLGEADAGFVYFTDVSTAKATVRVLEIPARYNVVATYPIAPVAKSGVERKAAAFVLLVLGKQGQAILRKHGFQ